MREILQIHAWRQVVDSNTRIVHCLSHPCSSVEKEHFARILWHFSPTFQLGRKTQLSLHRLFGGQMGWTSHLAAAPVVRSFVERYVRVSRVCFDAELALTQQCLAGARSCNHDRMFISTGVNSGCIPIEFIFE